MKKIILITVSGLDRPGITSRLTGTLARFQVNILDIGQSVIHDNLTLGLLLEIPASQGAEEILQSISRDADSLGMVIRETESSLEDYERWRRFDTNMMGLATDAVNRLFSNDNPLLRLGRDLGMGAISALPAARRAFIREAAGLTGELPSLFRDAA